MLTKLTLTVITVVLLFLAVHRAVLRLAGVCNALGVPGQRLGCVLCCAELYGRATCVLRCVAAQGACAVTSRHVMRSHACWHCGQHRKQDGCAARPHPHVTWRQAASDGAMALHGTTRNCAVTR